MDEAEVGEGHTVYSLLKCNQNQVLQTYFTVLCYISSSWGRMILLRDTQIYKNV